MALPIRPNQPHPQYNLPYQPRQQHNPPHKPRRQYDPRRPLAFIAMSLLALIFLAPFLWLVSVSLKSYADVGALPIHWLPQQIEWSNFGDALTQINFGQYATNSVVLSVIYTSLITVSSSIVGFGFARLRGIGKRPLFLIMLATIMLPPILTAIPTFVMFSKIGLTDTYWPWVFWGVASSPFLVFLFRQFFSTIPTELEEAALIDGCHYWRIYWQIFLPLSKPVLATAALLSFAQVWGDWFTQSIFLSGDQTTLAVAIAQGYTNNQGYQIFNIAAAGAIIYILPVLVVFFFAQQFFVKGIVTTGLKG
jgi:multiple sugar transport system permease protein